MVMPMASTMEARGPFFEAKASARPRMMQFTTISGMNSPRLWWRLLTKASRVMSTRVTKVAMTMIKQAIRIFEGMTLRSMDTRMLEQTSTKVAARPIPRLFSSDVVTARVGHMPSTRRKMGFSFQRPFTSSL